jgi:signal transduction histidine kinase/CheY-like chemotaxis protein
MSTGGPTYESRRNGEIRLVIVDSPDLAAPLVGALDVADIGAWMWVAGEGALYFSPGVLRLLDLPLHPTSDLLVRFLGCIHGEDQPAVRRLLAGEMAAGPFTLRYRFIPPNAPLRWIEDHGRIERAVSGELVRQGGALRDVTREIGHDHERAETNARLEALVNAMPFAVWGYSGSTTHELRVTHQNAESMARRGNLLGRGLNEVARELGTVWRAEMAHVLRGEVVRVRTADEVEDRVLDKIIAPVTVDGVVTGAVGVSIDVTDEQRAHAFESVLIDISKEFASRSADALGPALSRALEQIGRFFKAHSASVSEITDDQRVIVQHLWRASELPAGSPAVSEYDGRRIHRFLERYATNEPVVVRSLNDLPPDGPERAFLIESGVHSFAAVPARHSDGALVVLAVAARPGDEVAWTSDTTSLLRLAATLLSGVLARLRAEADQRAIDRRLQDARRLESLGVLAGGIAHDFNNLLTAILGNATLLRVEHGDSPELAGPLDEIEAASRRAAELCRQMLAFAGRGRFALQVLDVNALLRELESMTRVSLPENVAFQLALTEPLPAVLADHVQLRQLLMSLLVNAAEAIGDKPGTITVRTDQEVCTARDLSATNLHGPVAGGNYVRLSVADNGPGIAPEVVERIFEPFFTTKFAGRGLGLAAVGGIVRAHKGALRVRSQVGEGTTFELLLPAELRETASPTHEVGASSVAATWRATGTVLVVDDEAGVRKLVRAVLERAGLTVILAEDGQSAIDIFRRRAADIRLVLLDVAMPGLNGRDVLVAMRAIKPDVRAIVMTGYTTTDLTQSLSHVFLPKPFTPSTLKAAVQQALAEN